MIHVFTEAMNEGLKLQPRLWALALSAYDRWEAARRFGGNSQGYRWFLVIAAIVLLVLLMILVLISFRTHRKKDTQGDTLFYEYARKRGLSSAEKNLLLEIAHQAGLHSHESIFTFDAAFDRGIRKLMKKLDPQLSVEAKQILKNELAVLREKLGFVKSRPATVGESDKSEKLSSRQIPIGKKLDLTRRKSQNRGEALQAMVVENTDTELSIQLSESVRVTFGEPWTVRYYFGASVWEFDSTVISYDGKILILEHSENIRFINRRRFLRVPVKRQAYLASLPFCESLDTALNEKQLPRFIPALLTELAGPGLRLEADIELTVGERVMVVFDLPQDPHHADAGQATGSMVQDIALVRHVKKLEQGYSIAIELVGLNDSDINTLIRATNTAAVKAGVGEQMAASQSHETPEPEPVNTGA